MIDVLFKTLASIVLLPLAAITIVCAALLFLFGLGVFDIMKNGF